MTDNDKRDKYDEQAERITENFPDDWAPSCRRVTDALAAALRAQGAVIAKLQAQQTNCLCVCHDFPEHAKLQDALEANRFHCAEIERLKALLAFANEGLFILHHDARDAEIAQLKSKNQQIWAALTSEKRHELNKRWGT